MKRKIISSLVFGLALLALAILFLGRAAGWWDLSVLFPGWWTLFLIVPGVVSVINDGFNAGNGILTGIGVLLLLNAQGIIKLSGLWIAALVLGIAGVSIVLSSLGISSRGKKQSDAPSVSASTDTQDYPSYSVVFAGADHLNTSQNLQGATVSATFGAAKVDLRQAVISHDIAIKCEAVFGGVELFLPANVRTSVVGSPVFGAHDCKFVSSANADAPLVTVNCSAVFGGIEIK